MASDDVVVVVDERLGGAPFGVGPGWLGEDVPVVVAHDGVDLDDALVGATVILTAHSPVTAEMIASAPRLRLIAKGGIGVDNIDVEAAHRRGVHVSNVPGVRGRPAAEHALHLVLALARRGWARERSEWLSEPALQLEGRVLGVMGLGSIGRTVASMARGIDMSVVAVTRTPRTNDDVEIITIESLFDRADVVVSCLPATSETKGLVDGSLLSRMPAHGIFVNVGRGSTVVTDDLVTVLGAGHLGGVGLDVTDPEPLPADHPLRGFARVILTPHVAGQSDVANREAIERFRSNVTEVLEGRAPHDVV